MSASSAVKHFHEDMAAGWIGRLGIGCIHVVEYSVLFTGLLPMQTAVTFDPDCRIPLPDGQLLSRRRTPDRFRLPKTVNMH